MTLLFDELNNIETRIAEYIKSEILKSEKTKKEIAKDCDDMIFDMLVFSWAMARLDAIEELSKFYGVEINTEIDVDELERTINRKIDGKDYKDRVLEHIENDDIGGVVKVVETESMHNYNKAKDEVAKKTEKDKSATGKKIYKEWVTMGDEKVRDTHQYLDGVKVKLGDKFYTYDGDSADYPTGFSLAENNVNCRCTIVFS